MTDIQTRFANFRDAHPKTRIRTAAREMGTSEADLVATGVDGPALRLGAPEGGWREMLHAFETFGDVMALTRNDACVHERHGIYRNVSTDLPHGMGLLLNDDIDLRLFCARWAFGFAVANGERHSLQFFDRSGDAVHKVYLTEHSDRAAYDAFVATHGDGSAEALVTEARKGAAPDRPDAEVDAAAFLAGWEGLQDTHDFYPLLGQHRVGRVQALRLAEGRFTERAEARTVRRVLELAADRETPIMVFVGNPGALQIHTGPVSNLVERGPWFNVLDARFNLHLDETQIADVFVVVKPTEDGDVTAVEAYDAAGVQIVQLFGKRKPGIPELQQWRDLVADLPRLGVAA